MRMPQMWADGGPVPGPPRAQYWRSQRGGSRRNDQRILAWRRRQGLLAGAVAWLLHVNSALHDVCVCWGGRGRESERAPVLTS